MLFGVKLRRWILSPIKPCLSLPLLHEPPPGDPRHLGNRLANEVTFIMGGMPEALRMSQFAEGWRGTSGEFINPLLPPKNEKIEVGCYDYATKRVLPIAVPGTIRVTLFAKPHSKNERHKCAAELVPQLSATLPGDLPAKLSARLQTLREHQQDRREDPRLIRGPAGRRRGMQTRKNRPAAGGFPNQVPGIEPGAESPAPIQRGGARRAITAP
jgi:hypothetical protein